MGLIVSGRSFNYPTAQPGPSSRPESDGIIAVEVDHVSQTLKATVRRGKIEPPDDVVLPEKATVLVTITRKTCRLPHLTLGEHRLRRRPMWRVGVSPGSAPPNSRSITSTCAGLPGDSQAATTSSSRSGLIATSNSRSTPNLTRGFETFLMSKQNLRGLSPRTNHIWRLISSGEMLLQLPHDFSPRRV